MTPTDVCNIALAEAMTRTQISGFPPIDNTPSATTAKLFYSPKIQSVIRAANWNFTRRQALLTLLRATVINGVASSDPPPQPWQFQYLYPSDCLKARFLLQFITTTTGGIPLTTAPSNVVTPAMANTSIPFVEAIDIDENTHTPRKTILTNMPDAQLVYTADLSQYPDIWDKLFLSAATAVLGAYFAANLSGDDRAVQMMTAAAKGALDAARAANGNEAIPNIDRIPDWIQARFAGPIGWWSNSTGVWAWGWDACELPGGLFY